MGYEEMESQGALGLIAEAASALLLLFLFVAMLLSLPVIALFNRIFPDDNS